MSNNDHVEKCQVSNMQKSMIMQCPECNQDLCWGGDHDAEQIDDTQEGVVSNYSCQNEDCSINTLVIYYTNEKV